jgi:hypothetical protein
MGTAERGKNVCALVFFFLPEREGGLLAGMGGLSG